MNTLTHYPIPEWISIAFLLLIPLPFVLITLFVRKKTKQSSYHRTHLLVFAFFALYLAYIALSSYFGWFMRVSLPPSVLLLTTFPFATFLFLVIAKTKIFQFILEKAPLESFVKLHLFRVIGVFFIILASEDALPHWFAFIAGIGDILTAIGSIFVARAIQNKRNYAKKLVLFWNVFGTIDILFTAIAANVLTKISMDSGAMGVDSLAFFPFCIIPAFAPPMILFLHWTIFKKLKQFSK